MIPTGKQGSQFSFYLGNTIAQLSEIRTGTQLHDRHKTRYM